MNSRTELDKARSDLAEVETEIADRLAAKSEASKTSAEFSKWRDAYGAASAERERLLTVIENLEPIVATEESVEVKEELLRRYEAKAAANAKLASRIRADIAKANKILLDLVRDVAQSAAEDAEINASLPEDVEPLIPADFIARGRPGLDRKELKKTRTWMWVNARTGYLIGDQDSIRDCANGLGRRGLWHRNLSALFVRTGRIPSGGAGPASASTVADAAPAARRTGPRVRWRKMQLPRRCPCRTHKRGTSRRAARATHRNRVEACAGGQGSRGVSGAATAIIQTPPACTPL